jgi:hypothetical protein
MYGRIQKLVKDILRGVEMYWVGRVEVYAEKGHIKSFV